MREEEERVGQERSVGFLGRAREMDRLADPRPLRREPASVDLLTLIREDKRVNHKSVLRPGFQAMVMYRLGRWASEKPSRLPCLILAKILHVLIRNFYGIEVYWTARIGRRFKIAHQGAIVIHRHCVIGDDCMIRQGATIGASDDYDRDLAPIIGDRVQIGAGAMILGKVVIGDDVRIGPNAVVTMDIPSNSTVLPSRPRVITWK
jgi:serine O-acetyltransferase